MDYTDSDSEYLGFSSTVSGVCGGVLTAWFADRFSRRLKAITIAMFLLATVTFFWCALSNGSLTAL